MKYFARLLMTLCGVLMLAPVASGYQTTLIPRFSVTQEYNDNIFRTEEDKEHDFITLISPGITAGIEGRYKGVSLSYDPSIIFYHRFSEYDGGRHNARFSAWDDITRNIRFELTNAYMYTEDPGAETDADDRDTTIRRSREPYYTNSTNLDMTNTWGPSSTAGLGYGYGIRRHEDSDSEDSTSHNATANLSHQFRLVRLGFDADLGYTKGEFSGLQDEALLSDDFDQWNARIRLTRPFSRSFDGFVQYRHADMDYKDDEEDYRTYNPSIGINYNPTADTSFTFDVGYYRQDNSVSDDETGTTGTIGINKAFKRGSVGVAGSAGYDETYFGAENLGFEEFYEAEGTVQYSFMEALSGDLNVFYRFDKYRDRYPLREDETVRGRLGMTHQVKRWLSVRLEYSFHSVDSTLPEENYVENRGILTVTMMPSQPFRTRLAGEEAETGE